MRPAYNNSIVNLLSSIRGAFGDEVRDYAPLAQLPTTELARRQNVVLLVIDGLGDNYLRRHGTGSTLLRYRRDHITTVFPSTTAAAISTFMTGLAPQQHAITGWFTYFKELATVWTVMPFRPRFGGALLDHSKLNARDILGLPSLYERLDADCYVIAPQRIIRSDYNRAISSGATLVPYADLDQFFARIGQTLQRRGKRKYIYAYWPEFDAACHHHGVGSSEAQAHFRDLDRGFAGVREAFGGADTAFIVTADHGFIDATPEHTVMLADHPRLQQMLTVPLCGEPRVAYCYVRAARARAFEDYVGEYLGEACWCYRSESLLEQGYFGLHAPHPRLNERIGDYTLVMKDNYIIKDYVYGETPFSLVGVHGGVSDEEMLVPLVVA